MPVLFAFCFCDVRFIWVSRKNLCISPPVLCIVLIVLAVLTLSCYIHTDTRAAFFLNVLRTNGTLWCLLLLSGCVFSVTSILLKPWYSGQDDQVITGLLVMSAALIQISVMFLILNSTPGTTLT